MRRSVMQWLFIITILTSLIACGTNPGPTPSNRVTTDPSRKIKVVTTTTMIADSVRQVGGERVTVTPLMGAGVDPHLYKASANDVKLLDDADIIFYNGLELEGRLGDVLIKMARSRPTVAVAEDIAHSRLREPAEFEGKFDPHIWFDPTLWQETVRVISKHLVAIDPASKALYDAQTERYLKELTDLDQFVRTEIATIPAAGRVLITAHDAFGYFGQQYGVEVRGLQGVSTASEAGAADVQSLVDFIVERKIKAIFVESSIPETTIKAVQAGAVARGHQVAIGGQLFSDSLGPAGTPEGTYVGMVRHNVATIVKALR